MFFDDEKCHIYRSWDGHGRDSTRQQWANLENVKWCGLRYHRHNQLELLLWLTTMERLLTTRNYRLNINSWTKTETTSEHMLRKEQIVLSQTEITVTIMRLAELRSGHWLGLVHHKNWVYLPAFEVVQWDIRTQHLMSGLKQQERLSLEEQLEHALKVNQCASN